MSVVLLQATNEVAMWRHKCESGEGGVRSEEMDDMKRKLNAKLQDAEAQMEAALAKVSSLEKAKMKLSGELEDVVIEVERVSSSHHSSLN